MIANIILSLWIIFLAALAGLMLYRAHNNSGLYLPFQNYTTVGIPYVTLDVQGQKLNLIVDSGAAVSVITQEALSMVSYEPSMRQISISALTDENLPSGMVTIPINIDGTEIKEDFVVHPVDDLANFKVMHNIVAHGILGNEFFEQTGCKIDYKRHSVTLY